MLVMFSFAKAIFLETQNRRSKVGKNYTTVVRVWGVTSQQNAVRKQRGWVMKLVRGGGAAL